MAAAAHARMYATEDGDTSFASSPEELSRMREPPARACSAWKVAAMTALMAFMALAGTRMLAHNETQRQMFVKLAGTDSQYSDKQQTGCKNWASIHSFLGVVSNQAACLALCEADSACTSYNFQSTACEPDWPQNNGCLTLHATCDEAPNNCWSLHTKPGSTSSTSAASTSAASTSAAPSTTTSSTACAGSGSATVSCDCVGDWATNDKIAEPTDNNFKKTKTGSDYNAIACRASVKSLTCTVKTTAGHSRCCLTSSKDDTHACENGEQLGCYNGQINDKLSALGSCAVGDKLKVAVVGSNIKLYQNDNELKSYAAPTGASDGLYAKVFLHEHNKEITAEVVDA